MASRIYTLMLQDQSEVELSNESSANTVKINQHVLEEEAKDEDDEQSIAFF